MKTKILLSIALLFIFISGYSIKWTVTNSGFSFSPATLTITEGDSVLFSLGSIHNAVEVSLASWNADEASPLAGGFDEPLGGGLVLPAQLSVGTHYYVCTVHVATTGMKGTIIVNTSTGITDNYLQPDLQVYPNPAYNLLTVKSNDGLFGSDYTIYDQAGRQVLGGEITDETLYLDVSRLQTGIYFIQVTNKQRITCKFVKD
jgi:plastocyanin